MHYLKNKFVWMPFLTFFIIIIATQIILAGTTGKLVGTVTDAGNDAPITGVNIVIEGQAMGAATDIDGMFVILNIPPGYYEISANMIGYKKIMKQNVQIMTDRTVRLDFKLESTVLETEAIIVQAERPLVKRDETNKTVVLDFDVFQEMPIQEVNEAVALQAGMVTDESGELHLRGGRAGEVAYMIDGVLVQDPYYKSGAGGIRIDKYNIQELQMHTGAFGAEYGQAMSGIVNIVTKEGGQENYNIRFEYESIPLADSPFRKADWMLSSDLVDIPPGEENLYRDSFRHYANGLSDSAGYSETPTDYDQVGVSILAKPKFESIPKIGDLPVIFGNTLFGFFRANFSGQVPFVKNLTFLFSNRYSNRYSRFAWGYDSQREYSGKLTYRYEDIKINARIQRSNRYYKPYSHIWKYAPEGYEDRQRIVDQEVLDLTHAFSENGFYTLRLSRYYHKLLNYNPNRKFKISDLPKEIYENPDPTNLDNILENGLLDSAGNILYSASDWINRRSNTDDFYYKGDNGGYEDNRTTTWTAKFDLVYQLYQNHEIKTGFEYKKHIISRDRWRYPWSGSAHYIEIYDRDLMEFAGYIQDKMEYERFVLNLGFRYDYFDPNAFMWDDIYVPGTLDELTSEWIPTTESEADPQQHISPRIGLAYPVTEQVVFHSNYGHFYENPRFYDMYKHHNILTGGIPLMGNPKMKSQKTVQYEFGVKTQLGNNWALDISAYFKDITDLAASTFKNVFPYNFTVYDNSDYASVKGLDISLERKVGKHFSGILNYSLSYARGNESSSSDGYNNYRGEDVTLRPNKEYYLDFDRRHDLSLNTTFKTPKDFGSDIFGTKLLSSWNLNIVVQIASGLPYDPYIEEGNSNIYIEKNSARKPWFSQVDLRLMKTIDIGNQISMAGFVVVRNLFNRINTNYIWTRTGKAWDAGPTSSHTMDRIYNPANIDILREISVGLRFVFNTK